MLFCVVDFFYKFVFEGTEYNGEKIELESGVNSTTEWMANNDTKWSCEEGEEFADAKHTHVHCTE